MAMTSNSLSYALDEVVSGAAFDTLLESPMIGPAIFSFGPGTGYRNRVATFGTLGRFAQKTAGQEGTSGQIRQQFTRDFNHVAYSQVVTAERELLDDDRWGISSQIGRALGESANYSIEKDCADVFANAFTTTLTEDALSLCNGAHLNGLGANSQSNSGTTAISMTSVRTTREAMRRFKNYTGEEQPSSPNALLIPPELEEDAWEIVRSTGRPDNASNAANLYNGMFSLFVWEKLSDANNWFMLDMTKAKRQLLLKMRVSPEFFTSADQFSGNRKYGAYMRYSLGPVDWRFVYGHSVT